MIREKAYAYLRVSTLQQVDGNSLEGQEAEIRRYCEYQNIDIIGVYTDGGKSGKSIAGRPEFQRMLRDVEEKREVRYIVAWKMSRFGRNACDSLNALKLLQKNNVNLITVEDHIDTSNQMGRLFFTLMSALAEMERENIREQTANGKKYNALAGNWNGGQAPYGYTLENGRLVINEEEADIVRKIYAWFMESEDAGYSTVTAKLNEAGIKPRQKLRLDRKTMERSGTDEKIYLPVMEDWYTTSVKKILDSPVYCGKLRYGYYKIKDTADGKTKREYSDNPTIVDGKHEAIISEELWNKVQEKRAKVKKPKGRTDSTLETVNNVFNRIAKCPQCGGNMVSASSSYKTVGGKQRIYYQYICGYWNNHKKGKCSKNPIKAEFLEGTVVDAILEYVKRPNIVQEIAQYMDREMDTTKLDSEIAEIESKLKDLDKAENKQYEILSNIGIKYNNIRPEKIEENLDKINTQREEMLAQLENKQTQVEAVKLNKMDFEMIKELLVKFNDVYWAASKELRKRLVQSLVKEVKLGYDENGKVIPVSMTLNFTGEQIELMKENKEIFGLKDSSSETVALLSKLKTKKHVDIELHIDELDLTSSECKATYNNIKQYVFDKYGFKVSNLYIAQVKEKCGIKERENYNKPKNDDSKQPNCPIEKEEAIKDAFRHFQMI